MMDFNAMLPLMHNPEVSYVSLMISWYYSHNFFLAVEMGWGEGWLGMFP